MSNRPALSFVAPYSFKKCIKRLHHLSGRREIVSLLLVYNLQISIHVLEDTPTPSATFVIEAAQSKNSTVAYPMFSTVIGTLETIDENPSRAYVQLYRSANWLRQLMASISLITGVLLMVGIYWGISADGLPPTHASWLVVCNMMLLPLSIWLGFETHLENRRRFREIAKRLGYRPRPKGFARLFLHPLQQFIERSVTLIEKTKRSHIIEG